MGAQIGSGCFGSVREATMVHDPSCQVAVKILEKRLLDKKQIKNMNFEISIMEKIDHPNIVKYIESYNDSD